MPRDATGRGAIVAKPLAVRQSRTAGPKAVAVAPETPLAQPAQREQQVSAAIPAKVHARARRDAAGFDLTQLAKGVLAGELAIAVGGQHVQLAPSECLNRTIEAEQSKRANQVSVE